MRFDSQPVGAASAVSFEIELWALEDERACVP
jgi:hypothetical protein